MSDGLPVVVLAFANAQGDLLAALDAEREGIEASLRRLQPDHIDVETDPRARLETVQAIFETFRGRIQAFHYAGHANDDALLMADGSGNEAVYGKGLAAFFRRHESLRLVFLNGCATRGQVASFLAAGVPAVIATSRPVADRVANRFAQQFYDRLAAGETLGDAYEIARTVVESLEQGAAPPSGCRGLDLTGDGAAEDAVPWGLYSNDPRALGWKLPAPARAVPPLAAADSVANRTLHTRLVAELKRVNPAFQAQLQALAGFAPADPLQVRLQIINQFPTPVGEQIRKLFSDPALTRGRLRQLFITYNRTVQLFAFAMLAQLWDERLGEAPLDIPLEPQAMLDGFLTIRSENAESFDYFRLILAVLKVFDGKVTPFMAECVGLEASLQDEASLNAHAFMETLRSEFAETGNAPDRFRPAAPPEEIETLCREAEAHLAEILCDLAFLTLYRAVTVKSIEVQKFRSTEVTYLFREVNLSGAEVLRSETRMLRAQPSDSGSVVLRDYRNGKNLNLTPFVVDQNAIDSAASNLFFLAFHDPKADAYHFVNIVDDSVGLVAAAPEDPGDDPDGGLALQTESERRLGAIKAAFDGFRTTVLNAPAASAAP